MSETSFMTVDEVAEALRISKSYAYKLIRQLNNELKKEGYIVISGRINKNYFNERTCYKPNSKERSN